MSQRIVNTISNRMSLRAPQRASLEILQRVCEIVKLEKEPDLARQLEIIRSEFPTVASFDRDFLSLCFAIATGVGKTRLMGAFIAYLHLQHNVKHFFVLAPNLTIYNKLITDFTMNTPKYVFRGIGEFVTNPPIIVTGENYESGVGVREETIWMDNIIVNIFNIAKITAKDKGHYASGDKRSSVPRFRRLREELGESYFEYLANLDDLVVIMDESHRYRADAGMAAINELKPVLGLELTATPQVERGSKTEPFQNVIYDYPLAKAMDDGFVKEPAVATRKDFRPEGWSDEALEKLKLEDGVRIHEKTKVELEVYARNHQLPIVKPFMLVVATDTTHANDLQELIESEAFFDGSYKGKVIVVHSNIKGEEKDDVIQQLLTVEDPKNPVEIVIHVNMLKEGWDVTNLYTIVPLRAANSRTLVEQSIGRGLRLPYGKRVGNNDVDRLTIVSHDKFQEIIDHANDPNSIIRKGVVIGVDIPEQGKKPVTATPVYATPPQIEPQEGETARPADPAELERQQKIYEAVIPAIHRHEHLNTSEELLDEQVQKQLVEQVREALAPSQQEIDFGDDTRIADVVQEATARYNALSIDIPRVVITPRSEVKVTYAMFTLDLTNVHPQPSSQEILIQHLQDHQHYTLMKGDNLHGEKRFEDYLVRSLIDKNEICYDDHADYLYAMAKQVVEHLRGYLADDAEVENVLVVNHEQLAELVFTQMRQHRSEGEPDYAGSVTRGFQTFHENHFTIAAAERIRPYWETIPEGQRKDIRSMAFGGFQKCVYQVQKFDSYPELRLARVLERDDDVLKWMKPAPGTFKIHYSADKMYEPDFIIETRTAKFLCEPKRADQVDSADVQAKAEAARQWCKYASQHAEQHGGKPWRYVLLPDTCITEQSSWAGLKINVETRRTT